MNNEHWNNAEYTREEELFEPGTYQTGSTTPPKNHGGAIAVALVMGILICGLASIFMALRINIFQINNPAPTINSTPLQISAPEPTGDPLDVTKFADSVSTDPTEPTQETEHVGMATSPAGVENIPVAEGLSLQQIYEQTINSVVSISCTLPGGTATGTGVILSADGYIVTNAHVVEGAQFVRVILSAGKTLEARLVGMDTVSDLAVLKVDHEGLMPATLGDSNALRVGDLVVAIGDPLGISLRGTMTDGIVSGINRDIQVGGRTMTLIQTNAALNEGNSGGPLINCYGQVVGINTIKIGDHFSTAGVEGLGFAIPSTTVREIVNQIIAQGFVSGRPELGLGGTAVSLRYQLYYNLPGGLLLTEVDPESDAYVKGIRPDDVIMSVDGQRIFSFDDYQNVLFGLQVGDTVNVILYRDGKQYEVALTVGESGT